MVEVDIEVFKLFKDMMHTLAQIQNGVTLRNKTISKAGNTSAVIFVPRYLLGQKVKIHIIPENTEVAGLRQTIDKKDRALKKIREELKHHNADLVEAEEKVEEKEEEKEDDESY